MALGAPARVEAELPPFHVREMELAAMSCRVARTGYTGEDGVEIVCARDTTRQSSGGSLLAIGRELGVEPVGLAARDTLRLESRFALYGNEIDETTHPFEAGLGWTVKLDKPDFIGARRSNARKEQGLASAARRLRDGRARRRAAWLRHLQHRR